MKKVLTAVTAIGFAVALAPTAVASISITWAATYGFVPAGGDVVNGPGILPVVSDDALAQLIFTPTMTSDQAALGNPDYTTGDDIVLDSLVVMNTGATFEDFAFFDAGNITPIPFQTGFVYGRIFESTTVGNGTAYYDGPFLAVVDVVAPNPAQSYDLNVSPSFGNELVLTVVPEPTTLALFAIGFGTILYRRRQEA